MKVLIIGGTGTLSSPIVDECIRRGYEVTMINRGTRNRFINKKAELIKCDINDEEKLKSVISGIFFDCCIDFLVFNEKQLLKSLHLFAEARNVKQYIFISSAQAYNTSQKGIMTEDSSELIQPLWSYSVNKVKCEKLLQDYCKDKPFRYTIIRPGVTYGNTRIPYGMDPIRGKHWTMIERIKAGKPIIVWNNGENKLNLTHVHDFAKGAVGLIGNEGAYNETFNIVGDFVYSWEEVLSIIEKITGYVINRIDIPVDFYASELNEYVSGRLRGGRANDLCCSNVKLKSVVPEFISTITLEDGVRETLDYYMNNGFCDGFDYIWDAECDRIISRFCHITKHYSNLGSDKFLKNKNHDIGTTWSYSNLHFVNYDRNGWKNTINNMYDYYIEYYKGTIWEKVLKKSRMFVLRVYTIFN